jgi:hypothetical protein
MYFLPGNHDDRRLFYRYLFPGSQPAELFNLAFDHQGVRFICLDFGVDAKAVLFPQTRAFLAQAVQADAPLVILTHHHVTPVGARWLDEFVADEIDRFWEIVAAPDVKRRLLGILSGHVHITYDTDVEGIPVLGLRSTTLPFARSEHFALVHEPAQYRLVRIQGERLTTQVYTVPAQA